MKKQLKVSALAAAAVLSAAAMANAAPMEYNVFGASAQFDYWKAAAPAYLTSLGCTAGTVNFTGKHGFVQGTNCSSTLIPVNTASTSTGSKRDIDFRFSGIASGEFQAVGGVQTVNPDILCATEGGFYRKMKALPDASTTLVCKKVHLGAADLDAQSFTQSSSGQLHGPLGGGLYTPPTGVNTTGITKAGEAFAVPFGLFVNSAVTARHCTAGNIGDICSTDTECGGAAGSCSTTSTTIKNLSRLQTAMIFSGQVASWRDFGAAYDDKQVVACLRHAGSGTAATFDNMVMSAGSTGWGAGLPAAESVNDYATTGMPTLWYNESTDDVMKCVNGNNSAHPTTGDNTIAAVGYADADKGVGVAGTSDFVKKIKYDGNWPYATNIINGIYDWYSVATLWTHPSNIAQNAITNNAAKGLITFVKDPTKIPGYSPTNPTGKALYWVATSSMVFKRANDQAYPARQ